MWPTGSSPTSPSTRSPSQRTYSPMLVIPGADPFHPTGIGHRICNEAPNARCLEVDARALPKSSPTPSTPSANSCATPDDPRPPPLGEVPRRGGGGPPTAANLTYSQNNARDHDRSYPMQYEILHRPSYALARDPTRVRANSSRPRPAPWSPCPPAFPSRPACAADCLGGLKRSVLGGESFFINTFTAEQSGEVTIAPGLPGDIQAIEMDWRLPSSSSPAPSSPLPPTLRSTPPGAAPRASSPERA